MELFSSSWAIWKWLTIFQDRWACRIGKMPTLWWKTCSGTTLLESWRSDSSWSTMNRYLEFWSTLSISSSNYCRCTPRARFWLSRQTSCWKKRKREKLVTNRRKMKTSFKRILTTMRMTTLIRKMKMMKTRETKNKRRAKRNLRRKNTVIRKTTSLSLSKGSSMKFQSSPSLLTTPSFQSIWSSSSTEGLWAILHLSMSLCSSTLTG